MPAIAAIRTLGLSRWYERQLIESHAYLVTGFLCLIALFAGLEQLSGAVGWRLFSAIALVVAAAMVCLMAVRRYLLMLAYAEHIAEQGRCGHCGHRRIAVLDAGGDRGCELGDAWLKVRCHKCSHQWLSE